LTDKETPIPYYTLSFSNSAVYQEDQQNVLWTGNSFKELSEHVLVHRQSLPNERFLFILTQLPGGKAITAVSHTTASHP